MSYYTLLKMSKIATSMEHQRLDLNLKSKTHLGVVSDLRSDIVKFNASNTSYEIVNRWWNLILLLLKSIKKKQHHTLAVDDEAVLMEWCLLDILFSWQSCDLPRRRIRNITQIRLSISITFADRLLSSLPIQLSKCH